MSYATKEDVQEIVGQAVNDLSAVIHDLATMTSEKFELQDNKIDGLRTELKQEIADLRAELKQEVTDLRTELKQEVTDLRSEMRHEFSKVHAELNDIEERLTFLEKRTIEDADMLAEEVLDLKRRIKLLEADIKKIKAKR